MIPWICVRYEEKRWIPRSSRSPSRLSDEKHFSADKQRTTSSYKDNRGHDHEWNKNVNHESSEDLGASRGDKGGDHFDRANTTEQEQKHKSPPSEDHGRLHRVSFPSSNARIPLSYIYLFGETWYLII